MKEFVISNELEEQINAAESMDEVVQVCAEAGIPVTKERLEALAQVEADGKLIEDALGNVSDSGHLF